MKKPKISAESGSTNVRAVDRISLSEILAFQNPWWKTGRVEPERLGNFKRELFEKLTEDLKNKKVTSIIGPRRTGKTILIHQLIQNLLDKKVDPERIVYLQLDNPAILHEGLISELMDFTANLITESLDELKKPVYIFLDEVHKLERWGEQVKHWQDLNLKIKFIVSGSSASRILKGSGESLLGRISHNILLPLSFREFVRVKYDLDVKPLDLDAVSIKREYHRMVPHQQKVKIALRDYLHRGGYPALINEKMEDVFQILLEYKDLSLQRDIFELEEVRDTKTLNELVFILASLIGNRLSYNKLGSILLARVNTIKRYLSLLEDIYLVKESLVYKKPYSSVRQERKVFFVDTGFVNALTMTYELKDLSGLIENSVCSVIYRKTLEQEINPIQFYWIDGEEVDAILKPKGRLIPIEVKYTNRVDMTDLKGMLKFMDKFKVKMGIVVTKDLFEERKQDKKEIILIPAWLFLLGI